MIALDYETVARVLESWDAARRNCKDFEKDFGHLIIKRYVSKHIMHSKKAFSLMMFS